MSSRHFDLNASIARAAAAADDDDDPWVTFDFGPNYVEPPSGEDDNRPADERRRPWRMNVVELPGWIVMDYLCADTVAGSMRASRELIPAAMDPDQWPQFLAVLKDKQWKASLPVLDDFLGRIVRLQLGLPLDR